MEAAEKLNEVESEGDKSPSPVSCIGQQRSTIEGHRVTQNMCGDVGVGDNLIPLHGPPPPHMGSVLPPLPSPVGHQLPFLPLGHPHMNPVAADHHHHLSMNSDHMGHIDISSYYGESRRLKLTGMDKIPR